AAAAASRALRSVFVEHAVCRDTRAPWNVVAPHLRDRALESDFDAIELVRTLEDTVGHLLEPFLRPRAAEQHVDLVVVRLDVVVRDRPIDVESVAARGVALPRTVAQRAATPEIRPAGEHAGANPRVARAGRRRRPLVA